MENKLYVSPSPHIHGGDSISKNMYGVLIALVPAFLVSLYFFGLGALIVTVASVFFCVLFEYLIQKFLMKKEPTIYDGSAILTGVLLAFNLPSNLPIWIIAIGALAAIGIGKMSFGGLGNNIFNPALTGRIFLLISFPAQMTTWPVVGQLTSYADATTGATVLSLMNEGALDKMPTLSDMLIGNMGGSLGEVSALALLLGMGTPINTLIEAAGGIPENTGKIIGGGPMMGKALVSAEVPVTKGSSGVLLLTKEESVRKPMQDCIRCAKCVNVCPMGLNPAFLMKFTIYKDWEKAEGGYIQDCIECGSCSYTCPAHRPLLDQIRLGKGKVMGIIRARKS